MAEIYVGETRIDSTRRGFWEQSAVEDVRDDSGAFAPVLLAPRLVSGLRLVFPMNMTYGAEDKYCY
jgi:hypothetical protein